MSDIPISLFVPNEAGLKALWAAFSKNRYDMDDSIPDNPIGFVTWLASTGTQVFLLGKPEEPDGIFVFSGIIPGDAAFAHVFVWGHDKYAYADLIAVARVALGAVFVAHNLRRVIGMTPIVVPKAFAFAKAVGFKLVGTLREAFVVKGAVTDAWVTDMLRSDLEAAMGATMKKEV